MRLEGTSPFRPLRHSGSLGERVCVVLRLGHVNANTTDATTGATALSSGREGPASTVYRCERREKLTAVHPGHTPSSPSVMVIETGVAAPPVNLRIAVPVFLVIFVVIPGAWDIVRSSCDHDSTLYFVNRGYITGLFGHTYSASTSDGSEISSSVSEHGSTGMPLTLLILSARAAHGT